MIVSRLTDGYLVRSPAQAEAIGRRWGVGWEELVRLNGTKIQEPGFQGYIRLTDVPAPPIRKNQARQRASYAATPAPAPPPPAQRSPSPADDERAAQKILGAVARTEPARATPLEERQAQRILSA